MALEQLGIVSLGMVAMIVLMILRRRRYPEVALWKMVVLGVILTVAGVLGTMIMYFIETGKIGGTSFFGAILFVPILILPAMLLKLKYKTILNLSAASEAIMLAVMKLDCLAHDCCVGRYMPRLGFQFPSQIVEMVASLGVMLVLLQLERKDRGKHLYAWYLLLYGATRFVLN